MKICLIAPLFEPWNMGGAEKYINLLANSLSKDNEVLILTTKGPKDRNLTNDNKNLRIVELKQSNVASIYAIQKNQPRIGLSTRFIWTLFDFWNFSNFAQVKKILETEKPDIVHTNGIKGLSSSVFSAVKQTGIPHVHILHDYELISRWVTLMRHGKPIRFNLFDQMYIRFMKGISSHITSVITPSKFVMDSHVKMGFFKNSKKFVIPHGMNLKSVVKPREGIGKNFIILGRLHETKGIQIAIHAFKLIKQKDIRLHIVGEGNYFNVIKSLVHGDKRIVIHGYLNSQKLNALLDACSYGIVPSIWPETFGYIINEFMNEGLPVIASDLGAISELIKDGHNGFLFPSGDEQTLKKIIEKLINDDKILERLSKNAINSSMNFSMDKQLQMTRDVYTKSLN